MEVFAVLYCYVPFLYSNTKILYNPKQEVREGKEMVLSSKAPLKFRRSGQFTYIQT